MLLSAYVRDKETKQTLVIERDYPTKERFAKDLRGNGYTVIRISNKRDLKAQDQGFESFAKMKEFIAMYKENPTLWKDELERIEAIENIEL